MSRHNVSNCQREVLVKVILQLISLSALKNQDMLRNGTTKLHFSNSSFQEKGTDQEGRIEKK